MCKYHPLNVRTRQHLLSVFVLTKKRQHAFELVRVRVDDENPSADGHDAEFATRIHAVDRRAKCLLELEAIGEGESWPRYHVRCPR